jgi:hypothetical protein
MFPVTQYEKNNTHHHTMGFGVFLQNPSGQMITAANKQQICFFGGLLTVCAAVPHNISLPVV